MKYLCVKGMILLHTEIDLIFYSSVYVALVKMYCINLEILVELLSGSLIMNLIPYLMTKSSNGHLIINYGTL